MRPDAGAVHSLALKVRRRRTSTTRSFNCAGNASMLAWPENTIYSRRMPPAVADPLLVAITDTLVNRFAPERV